MTRDEIKQAISTKDDDWLESRWSVLDEAIKAIEPHLAEVEAAFDHDYSSKNDSDTLEKSVCDQVLELCNVVTTHDTEGIMSWGELLELINSEIEKREIPKKTTKWSIRADEAWRSDENQKRIKGLAKPAAVKGMKLEPPA